MARQRSQTAALCRDLRKYLCPRADTYRDKLSPCRVSPCSVTALPTAGRCGRTTSRVSNFSWAKSIIHILETLRLEIAAPTRQLFFRGGQGSDEGRQMIGNADQAAGPRPRCH